MKRINEFGQGGEDEEGPVVNGEQDRKDPEVVEKEGESLSVSAGGGTTSAHSSATHVQPEDGKVTKRQIK